MVTAELGTIEEPAVLLDSARVNCAIPSLNATVIQVYVSMVGVFTETTWFWELQVNSTSASLICVCSLYG